MHAGQSSEPEPSILTFLKPALRIWSRRDGEESIMMPANGRHDDSLSDHNIDVVLGKAEAASPGVELLDVLVPVREHAWDDTIRAYLRCPSPFKVLTVRFRAPQSDKARAVLEAVRGQVSPGHTNDLKRGCGCSDSGHCW